MVRHTSDYLFQSNRLAPSSSSSELGKRECDEGGRSGVKLRDGDLSNPLMTNEIHSSFVAILGRMNLQIILAIRLLGKEYSRNFIVTVIGVKKNIF